MDLDTSALYGGKVGYFLDSWHYFGVEAEAYHFSPDVGPQTVQGSGTINGTPVSVTVTNFVDLPIDVTTVAVNFILRGMLEESDAFPRGRLQGYMGVGGGAFIANFEIPGVGDDTSTVVGGQALAGVKWFPIEHLGLSLFAEYKFVFTDSFKFEGSALTLKTKLNSNLVYGGIAYHF